MVIETWDLTKYYGKKVGCRNISLSVERGEIFALLGPNGAGKSTFIKMLMGLIFPTSGEGSLLGKPLGNVEVRKRIGYLPENFKYQEWMTGAELLSFHASLYKMDKKEAVCRCGEVLEMVKLRGQEHYRVGTYSKGMQQRIGIASALLSDPDLIFFDEPTSALDPIGRKEVREILVELKESGKTILLNSHLLSEVEMVSDSLAIINKGRILKVGKMEDVLENKLTLEIHAENVVDEVMKKLKSFGSDITRSGSKIQMAVQNREVIHSIAALIIENGGRLYELTPRKESLESLFIQLVEGENEKC